MSAATFNLLAELRKVLSGKKTKASKEGLLYLAAEYVLADQRKKKKKK
jgi:hypothetical protein